MKGARTRVFAAYRGYDDRASNAHDSQATGSRLVHLVAIVLFAPNRKEDFGNQTVRDVNGRCHSTALSAEG